MGNSNESALFIKEYGNITLHQDLKSKRIDTVFIRCPKTIQLTSIGLCSSIDLKARAFLMIHDNKTSQSIYSQTIDLISDLKRQTSFYTLSLPVKLKKDRLYEISVDVHGGATYSYKEMLQLSVQKDLMINLTRDNPINYSSNSNLLSKNSPRLGSQDSLHTISEPSSSKLKRRRSRSFKLPLKNANTESLVDIDSIQDFSEYSKRDLKSNGQIDLNQTRDSFNTRFVCLKSPTVGSLMSFENRGSKQKESPTKKILQKLDDKIGTQINQITGICFSISNYELAICC